MLRLVVQAAPEWEIAETHLANPVHGAPEVTSPFVAGMAQVWSRQSCMSAKPRRYAIWPASCNASALVWKW